MSAEARVTLKEGQAERSRLLRVLGVVFGMAVTIGITIGMGILRTPGEVAAHLPEVELFVAVWVLGGVYAMLGAISVAELGTMLPRSGGFYVFTRRALGEYPGFVVGWSDWLSTCGTIAAVSLVVGEYAGALLPALRGRDAREIAVAVAVAFALLQLAGVRWGSRAQTLTSLVKTLAFFALIAAFFALGGGGETGPEASDPGFHAMPTGLAFWGAVVLALQSVIYTYDGWYSTVYFGGEVRDPVRDVPRSMIWSVVLVTGVYVLLNVALLYVLPLYRLAGERLAIGAASEAVFGARGGLIVSALATVSMLAAVNGSTLAAPRVLYAMSSDRLFWRRASDVSRGGTPSVALLLSTAAAVLLIVFSGTFQRILAALAFFFVINYTVTFVSVFVLRRREPETPRPYRAWGYPWTTGLALAGSVAFLAGAVAGDTANSVFALVLLALSYPAYLLIKNFGR